MKAIITGSENITPDIIKKVAEEKLKLVRPMLQALKSGNLKEIAKYSDIQPVDMSDFKHAYDEQINKMTGDSGYSHYNNPEYEEKHDIVGQVVLKLLELAVDANIAKKAAEITLEAKNDENESLPAFVKEAFKIALDMENRLIKNKNSDNIVKLHDKSDLRHVVDSQAQNGQSAYESLRMSGKIKDPEEFNG
jgi:hypothetical protein